MIKSGEIDYPSWKVVTSDQSIQDVIDSITDASYINRYAVYVLPGKYSEDITIPPYVGVFNQAGAWGNVTIHGSTTVNTDVVTMQSHAQIAGIIILPTVNKDSAIEITGSNVRVGGMGINGGQATVSKGISQLTSVSDVKIKDVSITQVGSGILVDDGVMELRDLVVGTSDYGIQATGGTLNAYSIISQGNTTDIFIDTGAVVNGYDLAYYTLLNSGTLNVDDIKTINDVTGAAGNIDLVPGGIIEITPNPGSHTITISAPTPVPGGVTGMGVAVDCTPTGTPVQGQINFEGDQLVTVGLQDNCVRVGNLAITIESGDLIFTLEGQEIAVLDHSGNLFIKGVIRTQSIDYP